MGIISSETEYSRYSKFMAMTSMTMKVKYHSRNQAGSRAED